MATVHVAMAAVAEDRRVAVFSKLREGGDIEQVDRIRHGF